MVYIIPSLIEEKISPRAKELIKKLDNFVENECVPAEPIFHKQIDKGEDRWKTVPPIIEELKKKARSLGLWNLFLSKNYHEGAGLTNLEYALMAEITDTGNMEVFAKYGTFAQKSKWLTPLLNGEIRSGFAMTEKKVASSDATNIETSILRVGNAYVINGHKWWISGAGDPRCAVFLVMGKSDPGNENKHRQQSLIIVPRNTPGINIIRPLTIFGYDDAPEGHCEIIFKDVRVPVENIILGEGRGFEVIQGRLGPGRIHHCMRAIGAAERGLQLMIERVTDPSRRTFGKLLAEHGTVVSDIAKSRMIIDQARFLVINAADMIDKVGAKHALKEIGMAKAIVPSMLLKVLDRSIQAHGAGGVSEDFPLAAMYAGGRTLRFADGPDEVHIQQIGKLELRRAREIKKANEKRSKLKPKL
ncbi:3979_t:CDS:2 [Funneliformis caledonium]|uniref:3979_t:CDS:1 n=1 Tax=Funneliformis caledonium TaxID=1117310 RepID=A0A9N9BDU5_9GLOM|nr:3979_t:CDS:2 [Funneliformis caledonium]